MHTPASVARHPLHPMLVPIPIGLWIGSLVCDLWNHLASSPPAWLGTVAFVTMAGGVVGALVAAVPGLVDALSLRHAPKRIAMVHMSLNLLVVVLYLVNLRLRWDGNQSLMPLALSLIGVMGIGISGWLGGSRWSRGTSRRRRRPRAARARSLESRHARASRRAARHPGGVPR